MSEMPAKPDVSFIVPVYNAEKYLGACLDSIVDQTHANIEIICVNDGSQDKSLAILQRYAARDPRIRLIDKQNEGQSVARNLAIGIASGKYLAFVDADDYIDRELCQKAFARCEADGCDLLIYDYHVVRGLDSEVPGSIGEASALARTDPGDKLELLELMGVVWSKFIRADYLSKNAIQFPEGYIYEDIYVHWQLILSTERISLLPERLYYYRVHSMATTQRKDWGTFDRLLILEKIRTFVESRGWLDRLGDYLTRLDLKTFFWFYDNVDSSLKGKALVEVRSRLRDDHLRYVESGDDLDWRVRAFFKAMNGHFFSSIRWHAWLMIRFLYRRLRALV